MEYKAGNIVVYIDNQISHNPYYLVKTMREFIESIEGLSDNKEESIRIFHRLTVVYTDIFV